MVHSLKSGMMVDVGDRHDESMAQRFDFARK
jgi:hypothetical protein